MLLIITSDLRLPGVILIISVGLLRGYLHVFKLSRIRVVIVQFCLSVSVGIAGIDLTGNYIWVSKSKFSSPLTTRSLSALSFSLRDASVRSQLGA